MVEARQGPAFTDEPFESPGVIGGVFRCQRQHLLFGAARRDRTGQVFLDRDGLIQIRIEREVGDAEATVPQHA